MLKSRPELVRVVTNYTRMAATFLLGLWFVRLMIDMDPGVFAVVTLIGTSVGISGMLREMIRGAVVPELGLALHSGDETRFVETFATAFWLSLTAALAAVAILTGIYIALPSLSIPPELLGAAGIFLLSRMAHTFLAILLAPCTNLLPISGRMARMNIWMTAERLFEVFSAFAILTIMNDSDPASQLETFAYVSAATMVATTVGWAFDGTRGDPRFRIRPLQATRIRAKQISSSVGWNGFVVVAMNLYERFDLFFMNIFFGVAGTIIFGIATQLLAYLRLVTTGLVQGLDATVARLTSGGENERAKTRKLFDTMGSLEGLTTLAAASFLFIHCQIIVNLWVGERLEDTEQIEKITLIFRIMLAGMIARSLSEGWMKFLSGSGNVHRYGPLLLAAAILNPFLVFGLYTLLPQSISYLCAAFAYTVLLVITHAVLLPRIVSDQTGLSLAEIWRSKLLPAGLTVAAIALTLVVTSLTNGNGLLTLAISTLIYAGFFAPAFLRSLSRL